MSDLLATGVSRLPQRLSQKHHLIQSRDQFVERRMPCRAGDALEFRIGRCRRRVSGAYALGHQYRVIIN
jgi:hypothetical protein